MEMDMPGTREQKHGTAFKVDLSTDRQSARVTGRLPHVPDGGRVDWIAAAPPEMRSSWAGSGLPFANKDQAFDNTPNHGTLKLAWGSARLDVTLRLPGSYYVGLGTVLVPPTLFLTYRTGGRVRVTHVPIAPPLPFRMNTYPAQFTAPRNSPMFYRVYPDPPVRTQEAILCAGAYPQDTFDMPENFWGTRPPR